MNEIAQILWNAYEATDVDISEPERPIRPWADRRLYEEALFLGMAEAVSAHLHAGAGPGGERPHVEDARYYVNAQSCETCAMPECDGPCYRCAVRAVQAALDAALPPPAPATEAR